MARWCGYIQFICPNHCLFLLLLMPVLNFISVLLLSFMILIRPLRKSPLVYRIFRRNRHQHFALPWRCSISIWALVVVLSFLLRSKWLSTHVFTSPWYLDYIAVHRNVCLDDQIRLMIGCTLPLYSVVCPICVLNLEKLQFFTDQFRLMNKLILHVQLLL